MKNFLFIISIALWLFLTVITGNAFKYLINNIGDNHITVKDVFGCYFIPGIFIGLGIMQLYFYLTRKM